MHCERKEERCISGDDARLLANKDLGREEGQMQAGVGMLGMTADLLLVYMLIVKWKEDGREERELANYWGCLVQFPLLGFLLGSL